MKKMPYELKNKLRQYNRAIIKTNSLHYTIAKLLDDYGVPYENLTACEEFSDYSQEPSTEALSYITNCEGGIEENIKLIEEIFLYFVNNKGDIK